MKSAAIILFLAGMLGQTFSKCILVLNYQLNKDYIANNLCENRDKPEMKCEGKCYLCKKIKKENKKDQENPDRKMENKSEWVDFLRSYAVRPPLELNVSIKYSEFEEHITGTFITKPFHPPQYDIFS